MTTTQKTQTGAHPTPTHTSVWEVTTAWVYCLEGAGEKHGSTQRIRKHHQRAEQEQRGLVVGDAKADANGCGVADDAAHGSGSLRGGVGLIRDLSKDFWGEMLASERRLHAITDSVWKLVWPLTDGGSSDADGVSSRRNRAAKQSDGFGFVHAQSLAG